MIIHAPSQASGGYASLVNAMAIALQRLQYNPPDISLLVSTPHDNVNALVHFTMWESTRLFPLQVGILNTRRLIIVPNKRDADDFRANGVIPEIVVCPLYCEGTFTSFAPMRPFRFITVGAEYGIPDRKRHHDLITAFQKAFPTQSDVELVIKRSPRCSPLANFDRRITIITDDLKPEELKALYGNCHVGIFPGGMESWNLPAAELAATGRASILPLFRGPAEYLDRTCAFPLDFEMKQVPKESFRSYGECPYVSVDGLISAMQQAYNSPFDVYARGLAAAQRASEYSLARFGVRLRNILHRYACQSGTKLETGRPPVRDGHLGEPSRVDSGAEKVGDAANPSVHDGSDDVGRIVASRSAVLH